jgi:endonuclease/exonuclease/phosphatase family metal-dependent hydrolase
MLGLLTMGRLAVVVAACAAVSGCSFALQGIPKNHAIESTFPDQGTAELPRQLEVVTFNVHKEPAPVIMRGIKGDRALRDADLLVMQEVPRWDDTCSAACGVAKEMGYYTVYAPAHHAEGKDIGVAILSKAPIRSARVIELPWNDVHFNAGRRAAVAVTIMQDGRPITVIGVHLENRLTVAERRRQMLPILEYAKQQATPVVIAGDFNTSPFTWVSHWLPIPTNTQDERLEELVRANGFDTPVKDSGATHRYIGMKLDAIYMRGFETKQFATAHALDVSDHLALWAILASKKSHRVSALN